MFETIVDTDELASHLGDPDWAIVDCRFSLDDPSIGRRAYENAHIPGAVYAHLNEDLSSPIIPGKTGRHPLPDVYTFEQKLGQWGIGDAVQVVAYDDSGGGIAARLWWLLRWLNHRPVAVLNGGWPQWLREGRPSRSGVESRRWRSFVARPRPELLVNADDVGNLRQDPAYVVGDSRTADRYRGENETIDPVAGHIPGALSIPYPDNLGQDGLFLSQNALRARFAAFLENRPAGQAIFYCGSGVTAAHNLLALAHAGLGEGRLYAGSWSEWIADPQRPVATGSASQLPPTRPG